MALNEILITISSLETHSIEIDLFYTLHYLYMYAEVFLMKTYLNEISRLFNKLNEEIMHCGDLPKKDFLVALCNNHHKLSLIVIRRQHLFNTSVIMIVLHIFVETSNAVLSLVSSARAVVKYHRIDQIFVIWDVLICVEMSTITWLIIKMRMDIVNEAEKTATYIHDIWNKLASKNQIDCYAKQLQLLALQLYNSKLSFTAYGFFALDWTLLHKIISAAATYVVILIQFEISSTTKNSVFASNSTV
ncbi:7tm Chemosensory receptor [Popillia japonica]|uniref:7tm Chemosensory receptor n=1 Tax=Popillia japonica TaxID=7064 RepID=A0AAW1MHJ5_POPJA